MPDTFTPEQISQILEEFFKVVGTRQYIGARYVPIFGRKDETSIEWDNTKPYEPLTIVLYQGNSYTSRQFVPVGVEITNQEFWAITGNYNAQIEMYRRETAAAREVADNALTAANNAQTDIDTLLPKADFSAENTVKKYVDDSVAEVQADIDTLLPKADFSAENTVKKYVDDSIDALDALKPFAFETVEDMKNAAENLYVGAICHTSGFHSSNDGGASWYIINSSDSANDMDVIQCGDYFAHLLLDKYATPEQFGAYGDGTHDDRDNIQRCVNVAQNVVMNKNYLVTIRGTEEVDWNIILIPSNRDIELNGTISVAPNSSRGYEIFSINRASHVNIHGVGSIIGDKLTHTGSDGEWGHCIRIAASTDVEISGITLQHGWGDGISVGSQINGMESGQPKRIYVHDCAVIDNSRNNISLVSVSDSVFSNLYVAGADRTEPRSGIDLEPNPNTNVEVVNNVTIENCVFENNGYADMLVLHTSGNNLESNVYIKNVTCTKQIAATLRDDNGHLHIDGATFHKSGVCFLLDSTENSDITIENASMYLEGKSSPIQLNTDVNNIAFSGDVYTTCPNRFITNATASVSGQNNVFNYRLRAKQTLGEDTGSSQMANTPIHKLFVEFTDTYIGDAALPNLPGYGCDVKINNPRTYINAYLSLARKGARYRIYNNSNGQTTLRNVSGSPILGTVDSGNVGVFESFQDGSISKIAEYPMPTVG